MTSLSDKVARVKELDAKRTQGEWIIEHDENCGDVTLWAGSAIEERESGMYDAAGEIKLYEAVYRECENDGEMLANADFIAHAPQMAALITQLWDENQAMQAEINEQCRIIGAGGERELRLRAVLEMAREGLNWADAFATGILNTKDLGQSDSRFAGEVLAKSVKALGMLNATLDAPLSAGRRPKGEATTDAITAIDNVMKGEGL
jgi:hypothetical protein